MYKPIMMQVIISVKLKNVTCQSSNRTKAQVVSIHFFPFIFFLFTFAISTEMPWMRLYSLAFYFFILYDIHAKVMVLVHDTWSECALQMYEVSLKYL